MSRNQTRPARAAINDFLASEAAGGMLLILVAALALVVANGPWAAAYFGLVHAQVGGVAVHAIVNDGLMTLFFLLVGLEIKREFLIGHLSRPRDRVLPLAAAAGGMVVPALLYLLLTTGMAGLARGWAIPAATDIAFAIGVLALLGPRVPASLRVFLATVAIADDLGAVAIIALAYTPQVSGPALLGAALALAAMFLLNRAGVRRLAPYLLFALLLWWAVLLSGVHATVAGVLAASAIPIGTPRAGGRDSPLQRLEQALAPWVAYGVVPLFGFLNAGVDLRGVGPDGLLAPVTVAVAIGLFVGKQAGIFGALWLAIRLGLGRRPDGASWSQLYGVSLLCGIGFTMSLFIGGLAFGDPAMMDRVRIGVLAGSLLSALAGLGWLGLVVSRRYETR